MNGFTRHRRSGKVIATFTGFEAELLRSLASQLVELLRHDAPASQRPADPLDAMTDLEASFEGDFAGPVHEPEDPVLARLLPAAYADDPEASGEFRRFTETALRDGKAAAAYALVEALQEAGLPDELDDHGAHEGMVIDVELDRDQAETWLRSLTDLRLAVATRLGVEQDDEASWHALPDDDPRAQAHDIYEWLGYVQETLVHALGEPT